MIEFVAEEERRLAIELESEDASPAVIMVIGVGGGGCNAVNRMIAAGVKGVRYATCNTDLQALRRTSAPTKLQIGSRLTKGLGAGADPDVGRNAALEDHQKIRRALVWPEPELPRTDGTRKLKRAAIREWAKGGAPAPARGAAAGADRLSTLLAKYAGRANLPATTTLDELGLIGAIREDAGRYRRPSADSEGIAGGTHARSTRAGGDALR